MIWNKIMREWGQDAVKLGDEGELDAEDVGKKEENVKEKGRAEKRTWAH